MSDGVTKNNSIVSRTERLFSENLYLISFAIVSMTSLKLALHNDLTVSG